MEGLKDKSVSFISTYPPMECGVGIFTYDLVSALMKLDSFSNPGNSKIQVITISDKEKYYSYDESVVFDMNKQNLEDYLRAADFLNKSATDVISLQHEYGIFGGKDGGYLITLLRDLQRPVITTLHTIQEKPTKFRKDILKKVSDFSKKVIVLSKKGKELLTKLYDVSPEKIKIIPHGTPNVLFTDTSNYKKYLHAEGRPVIFTFGLIRPSKGLEVSIEAMVEVAKEIPSVLYIILGATHPSFKGRHGESYRSVLERLVRDKGLDGNVIFRNEFVSRGELVKYLKGSDICLTPYLSRDQISSGVLSYALACGKAIVSTPYLYALELLENGRGALVPFKDPDALAKVIIEIVKDKEKREKMRRAAYDFGRAMVWENVAASYQYAFNFIDSEVGSQL